MSLRTLESKGYLTLPPMRSNPSGNTRRGLRIRKNQLAFDATLVTDVPSGSLTLRQVKGKADEVSWNQMVREHHYLGFRVSVGRSLKYLVFSGERVLAAASFSDAAWAVKARDEWWASLNPGTGDVRKYVINNSRFLIAPWVKVPNLASRVLSKLVKAVAVDWESYYSIRPLLIETFVDTSRFTGASYRAANWIFLGSTRGFRKTGASHSNGQAEKAVYVYPLDRKIRAALAAWQTGNHT